MSPVAAMVLAIHSPASTEADATPVVSVVSVDVAVDDEALGASPEAVAEALEGHVGDLGYRVRISEPNDPPRTDPREVHIKVRTAADDAWNVEFQRGDAPPWTRHIPPDGDADLRLEALGVIVRGILVDAPTPEPMDATVVPEDATEDATEDAQDPNATPTEVMSKREDTPEQPAARHQLRLSAGYRAESFDARVQHGAAAGFGWQHVLGPTFQADLAWGPPQAVQDLRIQRIPVQVALGWRFRRSSRIQPAVFGGATVEALGWTNAPVGTRAAPGWTSRAAIFVAAELAVNLSERVFASVRASGRGWVQGASLLERQASGRDAILIRTSRLSGSGLVGVGVRFDLGSQPQAGAR